MTITKKNVTLDDVAKGLVEADILKSTEKGSRPIDNLTDILESVAIANNTTADDVAYGVVGDTLTGQHYLVIENKAYYSSVALTGLISDLSTNTGVALITTTNGSYTLTVKSTRSHFVDVEDFGAVGGGVDDSEAFQLALDSAMYVRAQNGPYKIGNVDLNPGNQLIGGSGFNTNTDEGPTLIPADGCDYMLKLPSNAYIGGFLMYEPDQFLEFTSNYINESFIDTAIPIYIESAADSIVENMVVIGFKNIIKEADAGGVSRCIFRSIIGYAHDVAFDINRSLDIFRLSKIHLNPGTFSSVYGGNAGGNSYLVTKLALQACLFRFGRVDDCQIDACFSYGMKRFIEVVRDAYSGDDSSGGGLSVVNCSADACSQFFYLTRNDSSFGFAFTNCWATPIVTPLDGTTQASFLVGDGTLLCEANEITITNFKQFGQQPISQIDSARTSNATNMFKFSTNTQYNRASFSNSQAIQITGALYVNNGVSVDSLRNTYHGCEIITATAGDTALKDVKGETFLSAKDKALKTYGIHNNDNSTDEGIASGTYTLTQGAGSNVNVSSVNFASLSLYTKVGSIVEFSGIVSVVPLADATLTEVFVSLPVSYGSGAGYGSGGIYGKTQSVHCEKVGSDMRLSFVSDGTGNHYATFKFSYTVV